MVDRDDVFMSHAGGGAGFPMKAIACLGIACVLRVEQLDGNRPLQTGIERSEHHPHAAASNQFGNLKSIDLAEVIWILGWLQKAEVVVGIGIGTRLDSSGSR